MSPLGSESTILIDLDPVKTAALKQQMQAYPNTYVYTGDCNEVLLEEVLPRYRRRDFRRALWLLDPYGLHYKWSVVEAAGKEQSIELLLNFPIMDINRNVGRRDPSQAAEEDKLRMTAFWGDDSWREVVHSAKSTLFKEYPEKAHGDAIVGAYCERLKRVAGFTYVPDPILMSTANNAPLYYIVFASCNATGGRIASDIFRSYRRTRQ